MADQMSLTAGGRKGMPSEGTKITAVGVGKGKRKKGRRRKKKESIILLCSLRSIQCLFIFFCVLFYFMLFYLFIYFGMGGEVEMERT